jgi:hypothetical protein
MGVDTQVRKEGGRKRSKRNDRWGDIKGGRAFVIPWESLHHANCIRLSPHAHKLLIDLGRQYTGKNNGHLCPAWTLMQQVGWKSAETLFYATRELEHYGWIAKTRQGGRNSANLYRLTWHRIDAREGIELDVASPTFAPGNEWERERADFDRNTIARRKDAA